MRMQLEGRVVAITGAFGALGGAVVQAVLAEGGQVAAIDRAAAPRTPLEGAELFGDVDLSTEAGANAVVAAIVAKLGRLDALVNIAGGFRWETVGEGSLDTWDSLYSLNLRTAVAACRAALPHLPEGQGRIVNVGANGAVKAGAGMGAYAASKAGVAKLTEALAEELKQRGITVNAVLPSIIDTPANRADMPKADFGAWVTPRQLGEVIVFLLSSKASAVTGALLPVTGRV
jgi:NAD(P)-dependent dehydrogenase (short-subunit alcohol dehydrogenase family)